MSMDDIARYNLDQWQQQWNNFKKKYQANYTVMTPYEEDWFGNYIQKVKTDKETRLKMLEAITPELEELFGKGWRVLYKYYRPNLLVFCDWTRKEVESGKQITRERYNDYSINFTDSIPEWQVRNIWDIALHLYFAKRGYFIGTGEYQYSCFLGGSWKGTEDDNVKTMLHFLQILERLINKAHPNELFLLYSFHPLWEAKGEDHYIFSRCSVEWRQYTNTSTNKLHRLWFAPDLEERWWNSPERKQQDREERMAKGCSTIFIVAILAFLFYCLIFSQIDGFNY